MIGFLQKEHPEALPHSRQISFRGNGDSEDTAEERDAGHRKAAQRCL